MELLRYFVQDVFASLVRAPIWWYGRGVLFVGKSLAASVIGYARSIALGVWVKNIFVPMFGMHDWQSRIISFFVRLFQIFFRAFMLVIWSIVVFLAFLAYLALPVFTLTFFFYQLIGLIALYA